MPEVSALTIAAGREAHLHNVILGFEAQTSRPAELVIGVMQETCYDDLPETSFPVRQVLVTRPDGELPLAAARNAVASMAWGEVLAFVDVDCIPHPDFIADVARAVTPGGGLVMGEVVYLPQGTTDHGIDYALFDRVGARHSDRQAPPEEGLRRCEDYRCFWSLNFAIHREDWAASGGFDEGYYGYGGEDTDFGRVLEARDIGIWWMKGARVYHQFHDHCMPPVHHVASIIRNADHFASRWGERTMGHWLHAMRVMGLIEQRGGELHVLRDPTEADFALCRQTADMPYANTRRVLDKLQQSEKVGPERVAEVDRQQGDMARVAAE
ncbi:glycosyltransferase family 2 protein [Allosediminivita pacifica]|uniref:GT2 family glycosyltransferase n=1 Tax=Allosediminivita pacifica TaxID=1267769 RepID=A0A2T6B9F8_9RHOB|nr:galactosyltransferase-related protein [Allosediminivita pacifica]PTX52721.1 GT2 family glycosyltransferase [Allosediminivita pacifica]GGA96367.1 glycosyl transferase family A [Allosediminivita pacifica]